ncbi:TonB-dependent receptor [Fulvivirga maritima]|uniref:TonB-dependent receptor n=1 Tax=Fulvivirga maritima TaxID=2904247 RepID=UPI001F250C9F|nr:TonB-dependent receptor [Fulvivirga maritima]UII25714.1 TonB-dependent receptor [Fulvivirga maritima]
MCLKYITFWLCLLASFSLYAQSSIKGRVRDEEGEALVGASVELQETGKGTITDIHGDFSIEGLQAGDYNLEIHYIGYEKQVVSITLAENDSQSISIQLKSKNEQLDEVVVKGKSVEQAKREEPIKVEVIDTKKFQSQSISLPQVINQVSGVKVRQNGGIGSGATININGLQGNAIRFFKDGIPLDYLGSAFNLTVLPVDQLANIEIYKGVLPVDLGADALGGAVNFVSRENYDNNLDVSYSFGSFNTHQATINGYWNIPNTKLFASVSSYFIASANDYKIDVEIADPETGVNQEQEVRRFHDGINTSFIEGKIGVKNTKVADLFEVGAAYYDLEKELQNNIRLTDAYGEAMNYENDLIFSSRYKKRINKLTVDLFGAYSNRNTLFDDTPENRYNWLGEPTTISDNGGETSLNVQSYRNLDFDNWMVRLNLQYKLSENQKLSFNHNYIYEHRVGSDPYAELYNDEVDVLTFPAKYVRHISGLGLTSQFFNGRLENVFSLKRYAVVTSSVTSSAEFYGEVPEFSDDSYGVSNSIKYKFKEAQFIRLSYERATRIPESREYFGDAVFITGNPELEPEYSHNVNLGFFSALSKTGKLSLDVNGFYRYVEGNIFLRPYYLISSRYENTDDSQVLGGEMTLKGAWFDGRLKTNLALTYQDIRRKNVDITSMLLQDARQPNIPYFFGNLGARYTPKSFIDGANWEFYANYNYVEKYLLNSIPKQQEPSLFGSTSHLSGAVVIPSQHLVDAGVTCRLQKMPLHVSFELNNLLNADAYDGFRVQKPGINYRVKLKYSIN